MEAKAFCLWYLESVFCGWLNLQFITVLLILISVDVGHYAIKFNKLFGLSANRYREGYNFKIPFIETPIIFNVQTREDEIRAETANRDMQLVKLSVKVLFHP